MAAAPLLYSVGVIERSPELSAVGHSSAQPRMDACLQHRTLELRERHTSGALASQLGSLCRSIVGPGKAVLREVLVRKDGDLLCREVGYL